MCSVRKEIRNFEKWANSNCPKASEGESAFQVMEAVYRTCENSQALVSAFKGPHLLRGGRYRVETTLHGPPAMPRNLVVSLTVLPTLLLA